MGAWRIMGACLALGAVAYLTADGDGSSAQPVAAVAANAPVELTTAIRDAQAKQARSQERLAKLNTAMGELDRRPRAQAEAVSVTGGERAPASLPLSLDTSVATVPVATVPVPAAPVAR